MIPKILHIIWKNVPLPRAVQLHISEWKRLHPSWEICVWTKAEIDGLLELEFENKQAIVALLHQSDNTGHWADILRYLILWLYGGIYVDADVRPNKPLDPLIHMPAFVGEITPRYTDLGLQTLEIAVLGATPRHPLFRFVIDQITPWVEEHRNGSISVRTGPQFFEHQVRRWTHEWRLANANADLPLQLLHPTAFYPYLWDEREQAKNKFLDSFAVHLWWGTWTGGHGGAEVDLDSRGGVNAMDAATIELTAETARAASEAFISKIPPYTRTFSGRGIVICGGGVTYFTSAWVSISLLRHLGCTLPIQLWHLGQHEVDSVMTSLIADLGVECMNASEVRKQHPARILRAWELKPYSILHCPFEEVILLDADNTALKNPEYLFSIKEYEETGALFWPDIGKFEPDHPIWSLCGVSYRDEIPFESGQIVVDKRRCWEALCLAMWYNEHSDFFYNYVYGDKDTFRLALRKMNKAYSMPLGAVRKENEMYQQIGFDGDLLFQHQKKWNYFSTRDAGHLVHGSLCWSYFEDLRRRWNGTITKADATPDEVGVSPLDIPASTGRMVTYPLQMRVVSHKKGNFKTLRNTNVLIYWPYGFGDCVSLSYILPLLEPSNQYWVVCTSDEHTSMFDGCSYVKPIYLGDSMPQNWYASAFQDLHLGLDHDVIDGEIKCVNLPLSLLNACRRNDIDTLLWAALPNADEMTSASSYSRTRTLLTDLVNEKRLAGFDLSNPLCSSLSLDAPKWLQQWTESRLQNQLGLTGRRKLCLITRNGYSDFDKNWGFRWREEMPEGKRREGEECRDFMRLLLQRDSSWVFLVMEDRLYEGDDTVRSSEYNAFSYAEVFGSGNVAGPFSLVLKTLINVASLSVGIPAGALYFSMLYRALPTVGIWLNHAPNRYMEPKSASIHLIGQSVQEQKTDNRPEESYALSALPFRTRRVDSRIITGEDVMGAVETLLY